MVTLTHIETNAGVIAEMVLDRREKRNALTPDMLENIRIGAERIHEESSRPGALLLAAEGDVFCAGFDLSLCMGDPLAMADLLTRLARAAQALRRLPIPVVVAAKGAAIAGGCALIAGADFVITNGEARLGYPVVRLGVSPAVSAPLLRCAVGGGHCRERLLDPGLIDGREALRIGLAAECVDEPEQVRPRARALAEQLAALPASAMAETKHWQNEIDGSVDKMLQQRALQASLSLAGGEEERTLLAALWTKRTSK